MSLRFPKTRRMREDEAAKWLARLEGPATATDRGQFERWVEADRRNADAFERVSKAYAAAGLLRASSKPPAAAVKSQPATERRYALAAGIALAMALPVGLFVISEGGIFGTSEAKAMVFDTKVGELRTERLEDGSKLTLDADSAIELRFGGSERGAILKRGRARLAIAQQSVPFKIAAGAASIETRAALIDVETGSMSSRVDVLAGTARVSVPGTLEQPGPVVVPQGRGLVAQGGALSGYELGSPPDWTKGMLGFDATELRDVADIANRYSNRKLRVDEAVAGRRVSGAFRAGDVESLARALARGLGLRVTIEKNGDLRLTPEQRKTPSSG